MSALALSVLLSFVSAVAYAGGAIVQERVAVSSPGTQQYAPLRRSVTIEDVGNTAAFLCSDLAAGITGEVTYVDSGYNILGMTGIGDAD